MKSDRSQLVWTTNFDTLIADACARVYDTTGALTTVDLDAPSLAIQSIQEGRWPVEVKLHGDFRSRSLKNTTAELHSQDVRLRQTLVNSCQRFGLVVVGYSGRDESVMDALEEALDAPDAFPSGLFWLHRGDDVPFNRVTSFAFSGSECPSRSRIGPSRELRRDVARLGASHPRHGYERA